MWLLPFRSLLTTLTETTFEMDYLQVPSGHTRASLACKYYFLESFSPSDTPCLHTAELARLVSSIIVLHDDHASPGTGPAWLLRHFICSVITSSRSKTSTLLVALTYLNRVKTRLDPDSFGATFVRERIFIAALVLATKV